MALPGIVIGTDASVDTSGIEQRAYDKEMRRLASLRDITVTVRPADSSGSSEDAPSFDPFTLTFIEDTRIGDLVQECRSRLPMGEQSPPYVYEIGYTGRRWYPICERSNGPLSAVVADGITEIEVAVGAAPPPVYEKEEKGKVKGLKGLLGRMKSSAG